MDELFQAFERMIADIASPAKVRAIEHGGSIDSMWAVLEDSGFLDALVAEAAGGAGLNLVDFGELVFLLGRQAIAVPVAETMVARALLAEAGVDSPRGAIVLAQLCLLPDGTLGARAVPHAAVAQHILGEFDGELKLMPAAAIRAERTALPFSLAADLVCAADCEGARLAAPTGGLRASAAIVRACLIAGAADRLLQMTISYAGERTQFGKPIAKQQAIQQQLAVMAEQSVMARMAAKIGCSSAFPAKLLAAATAKQVAGAAAVQVAAIAHAVHGAIGISEEFDLQLFTRRLHEWRLADGSEGYWAQILGVDRLSVSVSSVDYVRSLVAPADHPGS